MSNLCPSTRRNFLKSCGAGIGSVAMTDLLAQENSSIGEVPLHFPAKAKHVIHLFMNGGPSHVDTFDPKIALEKYHGQTAPTKNLRTERPTGNVLKSPYKFKQYGECGLPVSEIFSHTAEHMDDICVIRSMHADVPNHEPSLMLMNTGESRLVRPSMGSWISYGLGSANENLPSFVTMCPGGYPIKESQNWQNAFLPGKYQATYIDTSGQRVEELIDHIRNNSVSERDQRQQLDLLKELNLQHSSVRDDDERLASRLESFELAYRMQSEASTAFDIQQESLSTRKMYGKGAFARQALIARRLVERGVRFVQLYTGAGQPWDNHDDLAKRHRDVAQGVDQAIGALLSDLKRTGMLDSTLVLWGGEFGRTPVVEMPKEGSNQGKMNGRDHNHYGFTCWMAGGGVKGGQAIGCTDELGFQAVENRVHVHDLHATILRLLGYDHERLTYRYAGRDFRLTDVHGKVVEDIFS
ncbi:MAG: sulfatase [Planctomycetaceae bacterium TMED240]|nr:sulfatase [Rhodopirellula sp.]OUX05258.1 MAG: sulfatase [Planctomycetaceae bacterium TMED240]